MNQATQRRCWNQRTLAEVVEAVRCGRSADYSIVGHPTYHPRVVFTNGTFRNGVHYGHLVCLSDAASQGQICVVAMNSDASLRALGRTSLHTEQQRVAVVDALMSVHQPYIVLFDEPTPIKLIEALRPDVLVKGGDYAGQDIVGAEFVKSYGGRVHFTPFVEGLSATRLLAESAHEKSPAG